MDAFTSVPARSGVATARVASPVVRRQLRTALDEDVHAAHKAVQAREERFALNRAFEGARRDQAAAEPVVATSWLSMPEWERARIRPARRRTAAGLLVLVHGDGTATPAGSGSGEVA